MATGKVAEKLAIDGGKPVRTEPFGPRWIFGEMDKRQLTEVIDNANAHGWRNRLKVKAFTEAFAKKHGVKHAIPVNTGTGALRAALQQPAHRRTRRTVFGEGNSD